MKTKSTKRALLSAILALVMTVSMLVGTTFAWFTDSVTSAGNKIVAGNLDVELYMFDGTSYVDISDETRPIFGEGGLIDANENVSNLWEPGKTQVVYLAIKNAGSLALKYKVSLNVTNITKSFNDVLAYTITPDAKADEADKKVTAWDGTNANNVALGEQVVSAPSTALAANAMHYFALSVHMDELANNDYMDATITFDLTVLATQLADESDSFGNNYDDGAGFQEITSPSVDRPAQGGGESTTFTSASGVSATVPAEVLDAMPSDVTEISLNHSAPKIEGNNVVFDAIDFVDQNGNVIDLSENTVPVEVKLPLKGKITAGSHVFISHDGVIVDDAIVDDDGNIVYNAAHFCEVEVAPVGEGKVARVGSGVYESIQAAVNAAKDGDTVSVVADVEQADGVIIENKNVTLDFNGKTFTVTTGASTNSRNILIKGTSEVSVINGTLVGAGDYSSGAYGTIRTEDDAKVTLDNLVLYNYRGNGLNIKGVGNSEITIKNTKIYSVYGGGIESAGATITVENVLVEQKGMYTAPYNSMAISVNGGGKVTVVSGTFSTECITAEEGYNQGTSHGPWVVGVLNSGGELIINGGVFSNDNFGDNALATAPRGMILADTAAKITVNGGSFNGFAHIVDIQNNLGDAAKNPVVTLRGGSYSCDPTLKNISNCIVVPAGYEVLENSGTYTVMSNAEILCALLAEGGKVVLDKDYVVDAPVVIPEGTIVELDLNGKTITGVAHKSVGAVIKNNGELKIYNGTVKSSANNGGSAIANNGVLDAEGVVLNGAPNADGSWPAYTVNNAGVMTVTNSLITSYHGAFCSYGEGALATLSDSEINMVGIDNFTSHGIYTYSNGAVVVNGGKIANYNETQFATGASAINGTVTVNGAEVIGRVENYYGTPVINSGKFTVEPKASFVNKSAVVTANGDGTWTVVLPVAAGNAEELMAALASGKDIILTADIDADFGITIPAGVTLYGGGFAITYAGTDDTYQLVKLNSGSAVKNVTLNNYRVRTESVATDATVTLANVTINMDNDLTGLDISRGTGKAILNKVVCKGTKDAAHLDPNTQVQVDYEPYGDVLVGTGWSFEATDCDFGSLHGWNATKGYKEFALNNTTYTVFRMHYWNGRTLYIDGVETAWSESGAIPVAHDVGGCWSVQPAFK